MCMECTHIHQMMSITGTRSWAIINQTLAARDILLLAVNGQFKMEFNNTTCISVTETEEINELIDDVNQYLLITQGIIVSVIGIVGMVINIFVMIVILANKQLHTRPFMLCLQLIVVNILFILFQYVPMVLTNFARVWLFGPIVCRLIATLTFFVLAWRWPVMFLMILDRLLTVTFPFCYRRRANSIMAVSSILLFFSFLLIALAPLVNIGCYNFTQYSLICVVSWQCSTVICYLFYIVLSLVVFIAGAVAPIFMYAVMYIKAWSFRRDLMRQSASDNSQYTASEKRAQKTILLLFICLVCLTLPGWLYYVVIQTFNIWPDAVLHIVDRIITDIYYCVPIADAAVILRNQDITCAIRRNMKSRCCFRNISQSVESTEVQSSSFSPS